MAQPTRTTEILHDGLFFWVARGQHSDSFSLKLSIRDHEH